MSTTSSERGRDRDQEGSSDEYGSIINITVGTRPEQRTFAVYEGLLKHYSSYFRAALKKEWAGENCKTLELPDDDPEVFRAFFNWGLSGKLYPRLTADGEIPLEQLLICQIYVFGDMRGIPELCNAAIDLCFQSFVHEWGLPVNDLHYMYKATSEGAALRRILVNIAVETFSWMGLKEDSFLYPHEFLVHVIAILTSEMLLREC